MAHAAGQLRLCVAWSCLHQRDTVGFLSIASLFVSGTGAPDLTGVTKLKKKKKKSKTERTVKYFTGTVCATLASLNPKVPLDSCGPTTVNLAMDQLKTKSTYKCTQIEHTMTSQCNPKSDFFHSRRYEPKIFHIYLMNFVAFIKKSPFLNYRPPNHSKNESIIKNTTSDLELYINTCSHLCRQSNQLNQQEHVTKRNG